MKTILSFLIFLVSFELFSQTIFFPEKDLITVGVYYYPEHWDKSQWDRDLKNISDLGFEFTHFAEFAWAFLEPSEGVFTFGWLDTAVALAEKHGLKVIMCTSTATPPVWLTRKHPEILQTNDNYTTSNHGDRQHASFSSDYFREYSQKMIAELGKHYGNNKNIIGWQLDNEPKGFNDFSANAQNRFRQWLKNKYKTIDMLNKAWGNAFWSQIYNKFDEVMIPNISIGNNNPHSILDHNMFKADETATFLTLQKETLRKYISTKQWITTNYISRISTVDPWRNKDLDFLSYTMYPVSGYDKGIGERGFRRGNPNNIAFANDFYRSIKGVTGCMELQPGQVNWGKKCNPQPQPGVVRMWLWHTYAGGCDFTCTYRYRQPLFGNEQYHYGIVNTDGTTPSRGGLEYSQFTKEIRELRKQFSTEYKIPTDYLARKTAFMINHENRWEQSQQSQSEQWNYLDHIINRYYTNVKSFCAPVDFIKEDADFLKYKVIIAPAYQLLDESLVLKWKKYAEQGGHLVLTCRTGQKDLNAQLREAPWASVITELIGAQVEFYDLLPENQNGSVKFNNASYNWNNWGEVLTPKIGTEVLAVHEKDFYKGLPAIIRKNYDKGSVTYIGVDTDDAKLEKDVLKQIYFKAGITIENLPEGLIKEYRDGFWIALNYSSDTIEVKIPTSAKIIFGNSKITSAEVVVWKE